MNIVENILGKDKTIGIPDVSKHVQSGLPDVSKQVEGEKEHECD